MCIAAKKEGREGNASRPQKYFAYEEKRKRNEKRENNFIQITGAVSVSYESENGEEPEFGGSFISPLTRSVQRTRIKGPKSKGTLAASLMNSHTQRQRQAGLDDVTEDAEGNRYGNVTLGTLKHRK